MNYLRPTFPDSVTALRALTAKVQKRLAQALDADEVPVEPNHGGVQAAHRGESSTEGGRRGSAGRDEGGHAGRQRRQQAMAAIRAFLGLADDNEVDLDVDLQQERVTFCVRNHATGEILREVPEEQAQALVLRLRDLQGALVDRSF